MLSRTSQDTSTDMYGSQWFDSIQLLRYFAKVVLQLMTSEHWTEWRSDRMLLVWYFMVFSILLEHIPCNMIYSNLFELIISRFQGCRDLRVIVKWCTLPASHGPDDTKPCSKIIWFVNLQWCHLLPFGLWFGKCVGSPSPGMFFSETRISGAAQVEYERASLACRARRVEDDSLPASTADLPSEVGLARVTRWHMVTLVLVHAGSW